MFPKKISQYHHTNTSRSQAEPINNLSKNHSAGAITTAPLVMAHVVEEVATLKPFMATSGTYSVAVSRTRIEEATQFLNEKGITVIEIDADDHAQSILWPESAQVNQCLMQHQGDTVTFHFRSWPLDMFSRPSIPFTETEFSETFAVNQDNKVKETFAQSQMALIEVSHDFCAHFKAQAFSVRAAGLPHHFTNALEAISHILDLHGCVLIGDTFHSNLSAKQALVTLMPKLKAIGVTHFVCEHVLYDVHGADLHDIRTDRAIESDDQIVLSGRIKKDLQTLSMNYMAKHAKFPGRLDAYGFDSVVEAALKNGISVVPMDCMASYLVACQSKKTEAEQDTIRSEALTYVCSEIHKHILKSSVGTPRVLYFAGGAHTAVGDDLSITEALQTVSVNFIDVDTSQNPRCDSQKTIQQRGNSFTFDFLFSCPIEGCERDKNLQTEYDKVLASIVEKKRLSQLDAKEMPTLVSGVQIEDSFPDEDSFPPGDYPAQGVMTTGRDVLDPDYVLHSSPPSPRRPSIEDIYTDDDHDELIP